jgi:glucose dehydrogenase
MADPIECDVAIVGSGFAGALIANELGKQGKAVVILEAGAGIPQDINAYMQRFYMASAKVPESPYTPELFDSEGLRDPGKVPAGRPTVLSLGPSDWRNPKKAYLVQKGPRPFGSTYDRIAGGTSHWLGTCLRFVPSDFKMKTLYGRSVPQFVDWPITYKTLMSSYAKAEGELGVSGNRKEQEYLDLQIPDEYPMPQIPGSLVDDAVKSALDSLDPSETAFLDMGPITKIPVRGTPAARNSQPYRNRRACAGNTNCIPICPIQAKYDPTITLNDALNTRSVRIISHAVVNDIVVDDNDLVSQINYLRYRGGEARIADRGIVKAKVYVIAANAIETPRLLLMSMNGGRTINGVANGSGMVGRHLMDHPYYVAWGLMPEGKEVYPYRGPLITSGIEDLRDGPFRDKRGAFRVDIGNEGWNFLVGGKGGDPNITTLDFVNGTNDSDLNGGTIRQALLGKDLARKLNGVIRRQFRVGFLVEQTPDADNRVTLSDFKDGLGLPRPQISYNLSDYTRKGIVAAHQMKKLLFQKMGADDRTKVLPDDPARFQEQIGGKAVDLTYIGAGHIMGTYRMGDDAKTSVVNSFQRSHDHPNLYLVGSGTFPTGATANPTLTIAALCMRTADHILENDFR